MKKHLQEQSKSGNIKKFSIVINIRRKTKNLKLVTKWARFWKVFKVVKKYIEASFRFVYKKNSIFLKIDRRIIMKIFCNALFVHRHINRKIAASKLPDSFKMQ